MRRGPGHRAEIFWPLRSDPGIPLVCSSEFAISLSPGLPDSDSHMKAHWDQNHTTRACSAFTIASPSCPSPPRLHRVYRYTARLSRPIRRTQRNRAAGIPHSQHGTFHPVGALKYEVSEKLVGSQIWAGIFRQGSQYVSCQQNALQLREAVDQTCNSCGRVVSQLIVASQPLSSSSACFCKRRKIGSCI